MKAPEYQSDELLVRGRVQKPIEVIRSATLVGAEIVGKVGQLGVVKEGAIAELLAVDGNPLEELKVLTEQGRWLGVIVKEGRVEKAYFAE